MPDQLIIAIGGTGKSVALVYLNLAKFFGDPAEVLVVDMPFGGETIDDLLNKEGVEQENFMTPWPGSGALQGRTFSQAIGLTTGGVDEPVARALFADEELGSLVEKGMNCRPIVGATMAMRKFWSPKPDKQLEALKAKVSPYNDVFIVGSITGGTGAGVMPTLARWLTEVCRKQVHGVLFLPWIEIGAGTGGGPSDAAMQANAYAVLSYLRDVDPATNDAARGAAPFKDYVVVGRPEDLDADSNATSANHPLHLLAANYVLYFDNLQKKNPQQSQGPHYLEIPAGGMRAPDVQPIKKGFSLEHAVYRQFWYRDVLSDLAGQKPDQAWDVMVPPIASSWLSWRVLRESVREIAVNFGGYPERSNIWQEMSKYLNHQALVTDERVKQFETITSKDSHHLVYEVDWDRLKQQAGASVGRARKKASKVKMPSFNMQVAQLDSARSASKAISEEVFKLLGSVATSVTKGGELGETRQGTSTVFLPSGVQIPSGTNDFTRNRLTNFQVLVDKFEGGRQAINMPDPQARRYQFKIVLAEALDEYRRDPSTQKWDQSEALAQFTALLEGVIFGKLELKLYDLMNYGFQSPYDRRVLGVLIDGGGNVVGGTDPDTLFFPAPEAWQGGLGPLKRLSDDNGRKRTTVSGNSSRLLLKRFVGVFGQNSSELWFRALDDYLRIHPPNPVVDELSIKSGWKQVGPIQLRMTGGTVKPGYLPLHEDQYVGLTTSALSRSFSLRDDEISLTSGQTEVAGILYPLRVGTGLTFSLLGAGSVRITDEGRRLGLLSAPHRINYEQLHQTCEALIGELGPSASDVDVNPFDYPDAVRLPFLHDGFVADYFLAGRKANQTYGERFLDAMRGRGVAASPEAPADKQPPCLVRRGDLLCFIDSGGVVYVESYRGKTMNELTLLGQALWMIFTGEATAIQTKEMFVDTSGQVVLEFNGERFVTGQGLAFAAPKQTDKAAELRGLVHYNETQRDDESMLFKEAVRSWLDRAGIQVSGASCERNDIRIGDRKWWCPKK